MKTWKTVLMFAVLTVMALTATSAWADFNVRVDARIDIRPQPRDLQVWIWPDRGEGGTYYPGERIYLNVEVTRDCFLVLYDIDTRGNLRILFPYDPWDDNFVAAGEVIRFPRYGDGYDWTVEGPSGVEYIQAIASEFPIDLPDWPVYLRSVNHGGAVWADPELRDFRAGGDRLGYIRIINRRITRRYWEYCATDLASFYVERRRYIPIPTWRDPWPEVFYGEIYIGWPAGGRIYIDGVYVGIAPLWVPRRHHGRHVITCYDGRRLVRRQTVRFRPKRDYDYRDRRYHAGDVYSYGHVKRARRGGVERFRHDPARRDSGRGKVIARKRSGHFEERPLNTPGFGRDHDGKERSPRSAERQRRIVPDTPVRKATTVRTGAVKTRESRVEVRVGKARYHTEGSPRVGKKETRKTEKVRKVGKHGQPKSFVRKDKSAKIAAKVNKRSERREESRSAKVSRKHGKTTSVRRKKR